MLGLDVVDGRVGGGEGAAVDALATLGLRVGARSGVRGAAGATDRRLAWPGAFEAAAAAAGGEVTLEARDVAGLDATTLEGRGFAAGAGFLGLGAAAGFGAGAGCEMICRMSVSLTKRPC